MSDHEDFKPIDLGVPEDAREFLSALHVGGKPVQHFYTSKGAKLTVAQMSDAQAVAFAKQMHAEMFDGADYIDNMNLDSSQVN